MRLWTFTRAGVGYDYREDDSKPIEPTNVATLAGWWTGLAACRGGHVFVAVVEGNPPEALPCPYVDISTDMSCPEEALPETEWYAACEATCECGRTWREVILDKVDILPERLRCGRCGAMTGALEPWPE